MSINTKFAPASARTCAKFVPSRPALPVKTMT